MHLLYVDESGAVGDPNQRFFVLAGVQVFERMTHWIEEELDELVRPLDPEDFASIELHGAPMRSGKGFWRKIGREDRTNLIKKALGCISKRVQNVRLFACVVDKQNLGRKDPVDICFEQLAMRFDIFLQHCHEEGDTQRGIMLFDKSSTEQRLQLLARDFKRNGHTKGKTRNYADVPVFMDSRATRLIQLADLVAHAIFRKYEHADSDFWEVIKDCFQQHTGVVHGFVLYDGANERPTTPLTARPIERRPHRIEQRPHPDTAMSAAFATAKLKPD